MKFAISIITDVKYKKIIALYQVLYAAFTLTRIIHQKSITACN